MTLIQCPYPEDAVRQCPAQRTALCGSSGEASGLHSPIQKKKRRGKEELHPKWHLKDQSGLGKKRHLEDKSPEWITPRYTP